MREFQDLRQTTKTMVKITAKFRERVLVSQYATNEVIKKKGYHDMLQDDISGVCEPVELQDLG